MEEHLSCLLTTAAESATTKILLDVETKVLAAQWDHQDLQHASSYSVILQRLKMMLEWQFWWLWKSRNKVISGEALEEACMHTSRVTSFFMYKQVLLIPTGHGKLWRDVCQFPVHGARSGELPGCLSACCLCKEGDNGRSAGADDKVLIYAPPYKRQTSLGIVLAANRPAELSHGNVVVHYVDTGLYLSSRGQAWGRWSQRSLWRSSAGMKATWMIHRSSMRNTK